MSAMNGRTARLVLSFPDFCCALVAAFALSLAFGGGPARAAQDPGAFARSLGAPLGFEENRGQMAGSARYATRGRDFALLLESDRAVMRTRRPGARAARGAAVPVWSISMRFAGARSEVRPVGETRLPGHVNYQRGIDPEEWILEVPRFASVRYPGVYPGVDVLYHGAADAVEYDFVVAPGADPDDIQVIFDGIDSLSVDEDGRLVLWSGVSRFLLDAPVAYQPSGGAEPARELVPVRYRMAGRRSIAFELGGYDDGRELVIDPVLLGTSVRFGGTGTETVRDLAVGAEGSLYVVGTTTSNDLLGASPAAIQGNGDGFVAAFEIGGQGLRYITYVGGSDFDTVDGVTGDTNRNAYIVGETNSDDFATPGGYIKTQPGGQDAFVAKLNGRGVMVYGSYYGTDADDGFAQSGIALGPGDVAWITGRTTHRTALPVLDAFQASSISTQSAYVAAFDMSQVDAASFVYGSYLSGNQDTAGHKVEVDGNGLVYVHGHTSASAGLIDPAQGFDPTYDALRDHFLVVLDPSLSGGAQRVYSTFIGGVGDEFEVGDLQVDDSGLVWVAGVTDSLAATFPVANAFQPENAGGSDFYVAAIDTTATGAASLLWSTFLGGTGSESSDLIGVAVDSIGRVSVAGQTGAGDFPLVGSLREFAKPGFGPNVGVVVTLDPTGQTQLTGTAVPAADALAIDGFDRLYVAGDTDRIHPLKGAVPFGPSGGRDVFFGRLDPATWGLALTAASTRKSVAPGEVFGVTLQVTNVGPTDASDVVVEIPAAGLDFDLLPAPCWFDGPDVLCELGDLGLGENWTITPRLEAPASGPIAISAQVSSGTPDPFAANDAVAIQVPVGPNARVPAAPLKLADFDVATPVYDIGAFALETDQGLFATSNGSFDDAMNFMVFEGSLPMYVQAGPDSDGTIAFGFVERNDWTPSSGDGTHLDEPWGNPSDRVYVTLDELGTLRLHSAAAYNGGVVVAETPIGVLPGRGLELVLDTVGRQATVLYEGNVVLHADPFVGGGAADPAAVGDDFVLTLGVGDEFLGSATVSHEKPAAGKNCGLGSEMMVLLPLIGLLRRRLRATASA